MIVKQPPEKETHQRKHIHLVDYEHTREPCLPRWLTVPFSVPCSLDDILVGAPLFMDREFESNPKEVGQVYLYLQVSALLFQDPQVLTGTEIFGRFGSSVAHLGDLNQDGYNGNL